MPFRMRNAAPAIVATRFADAGRNLQKAHSHLVRFVCFQLEANVHFLLYGGGERVTGGEAELETRSCADDEKRLFLEHGQVNLSRSGSVRQNAPRAGLGCLNSFPRMISGVPPGLVVRNRRWSGATEGGGSPTGGATDHRRRKNS